MEDTNRAAQTQGEDSIDPRIDAIRKIAKEEYGLEDPFDISAFVHGVIAARQAFIRELGEKHFREHVREHVQPHLDS